MISKRHTVAIYVNGNQIELYDQDSLNLRINNVIFDPSELSSKQGEYSFSFNIPITNKNSKIFNYANNLSKLNKFNKNYDCVVYSDDVELFNGKLKITSINNDEFKCNLVSIKINNVDDIFGDSKMTDLRWEVPFLGIDSINAVNSDLSTDYYFPLVSYGVFQKKPQTLYSSINSYTPKHTLDNTLQLYIETFPPSLRLSEVVKRLFASKGYTAQGSFFEDDIATSMYMSEYLKDKQDPLYNYGSDLGKLKLDWKWRNINRNGSSYSAVTPLEYNLTYPYEPAWGNYNFDVVNIWDIWSNGSDYLTEINYNNDNLFRENCIVVPADGLYKISLETEISIANAPTSMQVMLYQWEQGTAEKKSTTIRKNFENYPVEIQLVRNTNDCELIHGYTADNSVYPHEGAPIRSQYRRSSSGHYQNTVIKTKYNMGYMPKNGELLCFDPYVNANFIAGVSTIGSCPSVMKNGYSWNSESNDLNNVRYNCNGYWGVNQSGGSYSWELTDYNKNTLAGAPSNFMSSTGTYERKGKVTCIIELKKNDVVSLKCVGRNYELPDGVIGLSWYDIAVTGSLTFEAFSPNTNALIASDTLNYNQESEFDKNLNLGNFLNADEKQADFINNIIKAFNLSYIQNDSTVYLNKQNLNYNLPVISINIDDRVNSNEADSKPIEYPSSMQVKFSIDEEEAGFYDSVPSDKINLNNWKDYADIGSEVIKLVDMEENEKEEISLSTSYCWYTPFTYVEYNDDGEKIGTREIMLPIISKDEYMIEGYKYEDSMKVDGKGLKQRWWFRQPVNNKLKFKLTTGDEFYVTIPVGEKDDFLIEYTNQDNTMLTRYFNVLPMADSNFVEVECYLSPIEYKSLRNGANVIFDSDVYLISEISGYDPTGNNKTKLKLIKKT